jgi:hypothetical protein
MKINRERVSTLSERKRHMNGTTGHFVAYPKLGTLERAETQKRSGYWKNPMLQQIADAVNASKTDEARKIYDELFQESDGS